MTANSGASQTPHQLLMQERLERSRIVCDDIVLLFVAGQTELSSMLSHPQVELATDVGLITAGDSRAARIGKPLRVELLEPVGSIVMRLRPMRLDSNAVRIWCSPAAERLDYFQIANQRVQNYYPHLRRMPGTYDISSWSQEELDAVAPTDMRQFRLPRTRWSNLVITWGPSGYRRDELMTKAFVNGVPVAQAEGILHRLLLTLDSVRQQLNQEGNTFWHRMVLLSGIEVERIALLAKPLELPQVEALNEASWSDRESLVSAIPDPSPPEPALEDLYACAPGVRVPATDCEPQPDTLPLEVRKGDRFRYWHYEAEDALGKQALSCIPDETPIRWHVDVPEDGTYSLALHYQLMLPPRALSPNVTVEIDGACPDEGLRNVQLPPTTASGAQRPEANRYKAAPLTPEPMIPLKAGRHELALTFSGEWADDAAGDLPPDVVRNGFLIVDEILLTPWPLGTLPDVSGEFYGYLRPPDIIVEGIEERDEDTVYRLSFVNAEAAPMAGTLAIDASSDPGPELGLSANRLDFSSAGEGIDVALSVPAASGSRRVRQIRLVFAEDRGLTRKTYSIRHRRPFFIAERPQMLDGLGLLGFENWRSMTDAAREAAIQRLRADESLAPWRDRTPEEILADPPPLATGHGNSMIGEMAKLLTLTRDPDVAANLRAMLLAHAQLVSRRKPQNPDGERRDDVLTEYGGGRRGGIFGDLYPEDALAYDALLAMGTLTLDDQLAIEGNLLWRGYENSNRFVGELSYRGQAHNVMVAALLGLLLDDEPMLAEAEQAVVRFGTWQISRDGGHNEKASSYGMSIWTLVELTALLKRFGRPAVFEQLRETVHSAVTAMFRWSFSDGSPLRQGDGGIQRSFLIFSYGAHKRLAKELFPEDPETEQCFDYGDALLKRLEAKWEHVPTAQWPAVPPELLRSSDLFPDAGWAILRSAPRPDRMEVSLDWSAFGDHGHPDKLNSVLFAFDEVMSMDMSYGWSPLEHRSQGYAMRTVSHNTVVADLGCQLAGSKGRLWLFDHQPDVQVVWADAGSCYQDGIQADRCLVLLGDAVVDLFHLSGGRIHRYDWLFHCLGDFETTIPLSARRPFCPKLRQHEKVADFPGYDLLAELREGGCDGTAHFSWRLEGYPQMPGYWTGRPWLDYHLGTIHLDIVGSPGTTYVAGKAPFPLPTPDSFRPFLMTRRSARDVQFAAVFQARADDSVPPATVESLPVAQRGRALAPHEATAVQLCSADRATTVIQKHVPGCVSAGPIQLTDAQLAVISQGPNGSLLAMHAWNACRLEVAGEEGWRSALPGCVHKVCGT